MKFSIYQSHHQKELESFSLSLFVTFFKIVRQQERTFGKVTRSIRIPKNADSDNITVALDFGVLNVTIPKKGLLGRKLHLL